jgi:hypothetical protein
MLDNPSIVSNDGFFDGWFFVGRAALHGWLGGWSCAEPTTTVAGGW